jgi:hypothetical protein
MRKNNKQVTNIYEGRTAGTLNKLGEKMPLMMAIACVMDSALKNTQAIQVKKKVKAI